MDIDETETTEQEKQAIEKDQKQHEQDIIEPDEAAQSAEGLDNPEDHMLTEDVPEDRDATPPMATEIPDENIVR